jgi:hypothetical protein
VYRELGAIKLINGGMRIELGGGVGVEDDGYLSFIIWKHADNDDS